MNQCELIQIFSRLHPSVHRYITIISMTEQQPYNASPPQLPQAQVEGTVQQETSNQFPQSPTQSTCNTKSICTKINLIRLLILLLSTTCLIYTAVIISLSSDYFSLLFSYTDEKTSKTYLSLYYGANLAFLYVSTVGFIMILSNTTIFFFKFSFKNKMIYMHLALLIGYCVSGGMTVGNNDYAQMMELLLLLPPGGVVCFSMTYIFECFLASPFLAYRHQLIAYYVSFLILFVMFTAVYHYGAYKLTLNLEEQKREHIEALQHHNSNRIGIQTKQDLFPTQEKQEPQK